jgi:hypothetical protein
MDLLRCLITSRSLHTYSKFNNEICSFKYLRRMFFRHVSCLSYLTGFDSNFYQPQSRGFQLPLLAVRSLYAPPTGTSNRHRRLWTSFGRFCASTVTCNRSVPCCTLCIYTLPFVSVIIIVFIIVNVKCVMACMCRL